MLGIRDQNVNQSYTHVMRRNENGGKITANDLVDRRLSPSLSIVLDAQFSFFSIRISFYCLLLSSIITHLAEHSKKWKKHSELWRKSKNPIVVVDSFINHHSSWMANNRLDNSSLLSFTLFFRQVVMLLFTITPIPIRKNSTHIPTSLYSFLTAQSWTIHQCSSARSCSFSACLMCVHGIYVADEKTTFSLRFQQQSRIKSRLLPARWMETMMLEEILKEAIILWAMLTPLYMSSHSLYSTLDSMFHVVFSGASLLLLQLISISSSLRIQLDSSNDSFPSIWNQCDHRDFSLREGI